MKRIYTFILVFCLLLGLGVMSSRAYDLPAVNLGLTTFLDGGPPAGPGHYFTQYVQYYHSVRFEDSEGSSLLDPPTFPISADEELDAWVLLTQYIYQTDQEVLFGGKWGMDVIIPIVSLNMDSNLGFPEDNGGGIGDLLIGPFLQWDPIMGEKGPIFVHRVEFQLIFPTGKYDKDRELNPGSNFFSFNPYWAGTLFLGPKVTTSFRLHYLWNDENDDPNTKLYAGAEDTQAGQAIHGNLAVDYMILPNRLRVGLNGYYLKQISDTEVDGDKISGSREQVLGLGPGAVYHFSQEDHLFLNTYYEYEVENRPKGTRINLRWVHHF